MCKSLKDLTQEDGSIRAAEWRKTVEQALANGFLLTQMIQVQKLELVDLQQEIMRLFCSTQEDGGVDGVNATISQFCDGVEVAIEERNKSIRDLTERRAL